MTSEESERKPDWWVRRGLKCRRRTQVHYSDTSHIRVKTNVSSLTTPAEVFWFWPSVISCVFIRIVDDSVDVHRVCVYVCLWLSGSKWRRKRRVNFHCGPPHHSAIHLPTTADIAVDALMPAEARPLFIELLHFQARNRTELENFHISRWRHT